jgi:hypothetical protein
MFNRYLLQFYVNFFPNSINCSLIHFTPHLLKTLELFNYSFNVFISIVSGKHGRHELFNMLLCRTKNLNSTTIQYQTRSNNKTHKPLLSNNYS